MSRKFVSPRDPLWYERQRVSDLERRAARAATTVKAGRQRASQDEVGEANDGEVEVADGSPAIAEYVRSWGYFVVSRANGGQDSDTKSVN